MRFRFEELFTQLVLPLRDARSLRLEADFAEETATEYRRHVYEFTDLDVIVLEGIYLLKAGIRAALRPINLDRVQLRNRARTRRRAGPGRTAA